MTDPFTTATTPPSSGPSGRASGEAREDVANRDQYGRYMIPPLPLGAPVREDGRLAEPVEPDTAPGAWTRATTLAKTVSDTYTLDRWTTRMAVKGAALRPDLIALAAATPITDVKALDDIAEQAKDAASARARANFGTALHSFTEQVDRGEKPEVPAPWDRDVAAYVRCLEENGVTVLPELIERQVIVPGTDTGKVYGTAGTYDRIVRHNGRHRVLDLKTGRDLSFGWGEIAIQLALYAHAVARWEPTQGKRGMLVPMPDDLDQAVALVLHLPVGEATATLYEVNIAAGWEAVQLCSAVRAWRNRKGTLARVAAVDTLVGDEPTVTVTVESVVTDPVPAAPAELEAGPENPAPEEPKDGEGNPLAPLAGEGKKGCSVCRRTGHRKGSPKCLGENDPAFTDRATPADAQPATEPACPHAAGWTRDAVTGDWVCANCGEMSPQNAEAKAAREAAENPGHAAQEQADQATAPATEGEEPDPFADAPAPKEPTVEERIAAASTKAELKALRDEHVAAGTWNVHLQALAVKRLGEVAS